MRLLKLEITGFKSFQNKTTLHFPRGITAVVGPNGCGKSNIVDALRWVMGEQSVKQLRGKSMEDLIFAGADGRQPLNMAEVSLLIDNSTATPSQTSPMTAYTEIMVTRRLYRSGESVYMINRQPCRLKDIHTLFLGSGTGKNSFAVIQQGNIGALTDASPEERRYFIEDAADITKYKERKKETLARIKTTRENLVRITDIMAELKKRIGTLERQAVKAKKYKEYKARIKILEISIALWNFDTLSRDIREKTAAYERATRSEKDLGETIASLEVLTDNIRQTLADRKQTLSHLTRNSFDVQRSLDKKESDLDHLGREIRRLVREIRESRQKRQEVFTRNQTLLADIETERQSHAHVDGLIAEKEQSLAEKDRLLDAGRRRQQERELQKKSLAQTRMALAGDEARTASMLAHDEQRKNDLKRRLRFLDEERLMSGKDLDRVKTDKTRTENALKESQDLCRLMAEEKDESALGLKNARDERDRLRTTLRGLDMELSGHKSRYDTLKAMESEYAWYDNGVKSLMTRLRNTDDSRVKGVLADRMRPAKGFEKALEAALDPVLQYLLVDTAQDGKDLIDDLVRHNDGQCGFIPMSAVNPPPHIAIPEGLTLLASQVNCDPEDRDLVRFILGHTLVAENLETAVRLRDTVSPAVRLVTFAGETITEKGLMSGGGRTGGASIFARKNELFETRAAVDEGEEKKSGLSAKLASEEDKVQALTRLEADIREQMAAAEKERIRLDKELFMATETARQAEQKQEVLSLEQERLLGEEDEIDADMERRKAALLKIRDSLRENDEKTAAVGNLFNEDAGSLEKETAAMVELRTDLARLKAERDSHRSTLGRLASFLDESRKRFERLDQEDRDRKTQTLAHAKERLSCRSERKELTDLLNRLSGETQSCREELAAIEKTLKEKESERSGLEKQRARESDTLRVLDLELSQLKIRRENITARIEEKYHHQINQYKLEFAENELDRLDVSTLNIPFLETELEDLTVRVAQLGEVNLSSISEYDEVKDRHDFMESQEKDLEKSLADLETIIEKINEVSKERFLETFNAINDKLATLFPTLFEGGSARMTLTSPSDPLETGVELMIQPPGKKLTRLSLLSGGEKALSAIAFVFSIFLIKPASFCIMDEIDAPLDDANVTRFNTMVKHIGEQSQILVITHNKVTMEFADILFGVTMEKKGVSRIVSVSLTEAGDIEPGREPALANV